MSQNNALRLDPAIEGSRSPLPPRPETSQVGNHPGAEASQLYPSLDQEYESKGKAPACPQQDSSDGTQPQDARMLDDLALRPRCRQEDQHTTQAPPAGPDYAEHEALKDEIRILHARLALRDDPGLRNDKSATPEVQREGRGPPLSAWPPNYTRDEGYPQHYGDPRGYPPPGLSTPFRPQTLHPAAPGGGGRKSIKGFQSIELVLNTKDM
ncbi:hypothetical protein KEM55_000774 [Ascosphaera atra]|nr:hypothetical protein KEM55_000774 [Ascosphaera atra]